MSVGPDRINMEVVQTRCTTCGHECYCLLHPLATVIESGLGAKRCQAPRTHTSVVPFSPLPVSLEVCGGVLMLTSGRGIVHRVVSVGAAWWNVDEPKDTEFLGARPGYVWREKERQRRGRWRG